MDAVLGLDTSCYTTSAAAVDALGSAQEARLYVERLVSRLMNQAV